MPRPWPLHWIPANLVLEGECDSRVRSRWALPCRAIASWLIVIFTAGLSFPKGILQLWSLSSSPDVLFPTIPPSKRVYRWKDTATVHTIFANIAVWKSGFSEASLYRSLHAHSQYLRSWAFYECGRISLPPCTQQQFFYSLFLFFLLEKWFFWNSQ